MAIAPLRSAKLRQRVTVYRPIETPDAGGSTTTWTVAARPWCQVEGWSKPRGSEEVSAEALQSGSLFKIVMRYRSALDGATDLQILYGTRTLNVTAAYDPDGRREQLWLTAETIGARDMGL